MSDVANRLRERAIRSGLSREADIEWASARLVAMVGLASPRFVAQIALGTEDPAGVVESLIDLATKARQALEEVGLEARKVDLTSRSREVFDQVRVFAPLVQATTSSLAKEVFEARPGRAHHESWEHDLLRMGMGRLTISYTPRTRTATHLTRLGPDPDEPIVKLCDGKPEPAKYQAWWGVTGQEANWYYGTGLGNCNKCKHAAHDVEHLWGELQ